MVNKVQRLLLLLDLGSRSHFNIKSLINVSGDAILDIFRNWHLHMQDHNEIWKTNIPVGKMLQGITFEYYLFRRRALGNLRATVGITQATKFTSDSKLKARFMANSGKL